MSSDQAAVTLRLLAVIRAGLGRSIAWDEAIAATLRAMDWDEEAISSLFAILEEPP